MTKFIAGTMLDVPLDIRTLDQSVDDSLSAIDGRCDTLVFACANAHSVLVAQDDSDFMEALHSAELVVSDGSGITLMGNIAGINTGPHITGEDYFRGVMKALAARGRGRVFFFGSTEQVLERIASRVALEFGGVEVCGILPPPFGEWENDKNIEMINAINLAEPDVLWVGMTAPKQEKWVAQNREHLNVPVIGSIGAVFDFFSGTKPSAPGWMRRWGLEWLFRTICEPVRIGKRTLTIPKFIVLVLRRHVFNGK